VSVAVPLEELRTELERRAGSVFLLTVGDNGRPHCVAVALRWDGGDIEVRTGRSSARNAQARPGVSLLAPPLPLSDRRPARDGEADTGGHSLIVDGDATDTDAAPEGGGIVRFRPTHAVFHRPAEGTDGASGHDCVRVFDRASGTAPAT
jgi:Pyridoxamine 5'-phosphate oxidase